MSDLEMYNPEEVTRCKQAEDVCVCACVCVGTKLF